MTAAPAPPYAAGAGELAGALPGADTLASRFNVAGSTAGAPHAAQNFRDPISSAPHFAHFVMDGPS